MRQKFTNKIRPAFRRILKEYKSLKALADFLGCSWQNVAVMKGRGYMGKKWAKKAQELTDGKYKARMLAKRGEIPA